MDILFYLSTQYSTPLRADIKRFIVELASSSVKSSRYAVMNVNGQLYFPILLNEMLFLPVMY